MRGQRYETNEAL